MRHEVPEDLVGIGSSHRTTLSQDQEVQLALPVKLQDLEDLPPKVLGPLVHSTHDKVPIVSEVLVEELEVVVFKIRSSRILQVLQPSQGRQCILRSSIGTCRTLQRYRC